MDTVDAHDAQRHFFSLLKQVAKGEKITITRDGAPVAVLMSPQDAAFKLALDKANRTLSKALKKLAE